MAFITVIAVTGLAGTSSATAGPVQPSQVAPTVPSFCTTSVLTNENDPLCQVANGLMSQKNGAQASPSRLAPALQSGALVPGASGTWQNAMGIPGIAALSTGGPAEATSVSCASPGNCSTGGFYTDSALHSQPFVADEVNGTWHNAIEIPGTAAQTTGGFAQPTSVSCASPGNCSTVGANVDGGEAQAFVADEVNGTWHNAIEVPGIAALDTGRFASANSVSCTSPGNCSTIGMYTDITFRRHAFVADEVNGTWQNAIEVPGIAALNTGGQANANSVSCTSPGNCSTGGSYTDSALHSQPFVADEVNGTWHNAIEVPGIAALNTGRFASVNSVSCAAPGNCSTGGSYTDSADRTQAFVADEVNGTWHNAIEVPGTAALDTAGQATVPCAAPGSCSANVTSVSCAAPGNCSTVGSYVDSADSGHAFVADEVDGTWQTAIQVPGTDFASGTSVSCASPRKCTAVGSAFVVSTS